MLAEFMKKTIESKLAKAGITVNGSQDYDITIIDPRAYQKIFTRHSLGFGESYMEGLWDCPRLDRMIYRLYRAAQVEPVGIDLGFIAHKFFSRLLNYQNISRSKAVCELHYDLDVELFQSFLGKEVIYSCANWDGASTLEIAQEQKFKYICQSLRLEPGMTVLDIGCGWGGFLKYATKNYGVTGVGYTLSDQQALHARSVCKSLPVTIVCSDYREIKGQFDRIVSVEMLEAVGHKNYLQFFQVANHALKKGGEMYLQTIGNKKNVYNTDPWVHKYIFPNGLLPSMEQIASAIDDYFVIDRFYEAGHDYDKTLMTWMDNFRKSELAMSDRYTDSFRRMWGFYLQSCAGAFRARHILLWRMHLSPVSSCK